MLAGVSALHNDPGRWHDLASRQADVLSRQQLRDLGLDRHFVRNQLRAARWQSVGPLVVCTTTGPLTRRQRLWAAVLNAGPQAAVGGLTAGEMHGLRSWRREVDCVLVPKSERLPRIPGIRYVETRRDLPAMTSDRSTLPVLRLEPAILLFGAYHRVERTACGLLAAAVQQGLTTPAALHDWVALLHPLRRARVFRSVLADIAGGAESMAEVDVGRLCRAHGLPLPRRQVRRRDADGVNRYTDCEWDLPDGRVVVLEVDGGLHMHAARWAADMTRERGLVVAGRVVLRCTTYEIRRDPDRVVRDLRALGVDRVVRRSGADSARSYGRPG